MPGLPKASSQHAHIEEYNAQAVKPHQDATMHRIMLIR